MFVILPRSKAVPLKLVCVNVRRERPNKIKRYTEHDMQ